jgi:hypothetical protein
LFDGVENEAAVGVERLALGVFDRGVLDFRRGDGPSPSLPGVLAADEADPPSRRHGATGVDDREPDEIVVLCDTTTFFALFFLRRLHHAHGSSPIAKGMGRRNSETKIRDHKKTSQNNGGNRRKKIPDSGCQSKRNSDSHTRLRMPKKTE